MKKILIVEDESLVGHHLKLILTSAGYKVTGISESVNEALTSIDEQKPDLVLLDIHLKGVSNGIDLARKLTERNMAFVYLTANFQGALLEEAKSTMPFGFIVKPFREDDLLTTLDVAFYRHQNSLESSRQQEMELNQKLKEIRNYDGDRVQKLLRVADKIQAYVPFDYLNFILKNANSTTVTSIGFLRIGFDEYQVLGEQELLNVTGIDHISLKNIYSSLPTLNRAKYFNDEEFDHLCNQNSLSKIIADTYDFESALFFPVLQDNSVLIRYEFYSRKGNTYGQQHVALLSRLLNVLGSILENDRQKIITDHQPSVLSTEPLLPKERIRDFDGIVGQSRPMLTVLDHIDTISPLDTSVLILGESGTGKERVAKSIHALSGRSGKPLVVVNCASLPANLIESELFGHEKGAFTGALEKRTGKFEMASGGTIFLDEIGELPIDLQVKLLRVLQEQEIERLGGRGPIKIDVRIIAATNRDLEKEMEEGRFRLDLYYRLFVFPIIIPSLRERIDDIPALTNHFISYFSKKYKKQISGISPEAIAQMLDYAWPGNVRELEHLIERTILLSKTSIIEQVLLPKHPSDKTSSEPQAGARMKTIDENERDYIINVLKNCNGRIRGAGGAAAVMGLPPTTLHSKMKRLGIK
ncbi:sigma 54-interacting transcriptional regulator [Mucilaginibacter gossypii]|uniref:Response regulator receiver domain-containing protein n=1 Tax=Mucilaginibacter gossypii TaxID=551996 RepID=A0A1G8AC22_9SPHI|nr:sigma 54-interacting transcriptional regulator [Mucilaginibacter gossypii]SDH18427.1 Response regulator receiver domain-containing protein [Mucilaginibacter gossypii]